jgi:hypothetical protein
MKIITRDIIMISTTWAFGIIVGNIKSLWWIVIATIFALGMAIFCVLTQDGINK